MTTVYLIRHAQAEGNLYRRYQGWFDGFITDKGHAQIRALEERLAKIPIDVVYSSDLTRTMTTAQAACRPHGLLLNTNSLLREICGGCWEDRTWGDLLLENRQSVIDFLCCDPTWQVEGSETYAQVQTRFHTEVERIASAHPGKTVAIFSHGSAIRTGIAYWLGVPLAQLNDLALGDNTSVAKLEIEHGNVRVCYYNDASHLSPALAGSYAKDHASQQEALRSMERRSLRFAPMDLPAQTQFYLDARAEGWMASHGTMDGFDGDAFLRAALAHHSYAPNCVLMAYAGNKPAGILQMDWSQQDEPEVGRIPFFYVTPQFRSQGLGVQLLGQAVSDYRAQGKRYLRLRCAPENTRAKKFYERYGFAKVGEESGGIGHLDTMEKYIGTY